MTREERDSWFNTGSFVALVVASLIWKGPDLKVRLLHAAILFAAWMLIRFLYTKFSPNPAQDVTPESDE